MSSITTTNSEPLSIASIIIFVVFVPPVTYCLWRHGKRGFIGWFYIQALCIIRIAGNALELHAYHTHSTGSLTTVILQNIGLAPLLLGSVGILHEARRARNPNLRRNLEWFLVILYHIIVSAVLVLLVVGIVNIGDGNAGRITLVKIGIALTLLCWVVLMAWTLVSLRSHQSDVTSEGYADGTKLLYGVVIGLPFILLRELFTAGSYFAPSSKFTTSFAIKVCMSVIPEMLVTSIFVLVGISTRNISYAIKRGQQ